MALRYLHQQQFTENLFKRESQGSGLTAISLQGLQALLLMFILKMVQKLGWWFGERQLSSPSPSSPSLRKGWGWR